jgi:hypothetical protein
MMRSVSGEFPGIVMGVENTGWTNALFPIGLDGLDQEMSLMSNLVTPHCYFRNFLPLSFID